MSLNVGARLGHYEVTAKLGEGGMGEVWEATDTKLNRQVALKILPEAFANDPDRLARFQREAQVLASLNHPNIGHIYGLEEAEGQKALVLELIEGPTLADRIKQGAIPVDEALPIAKQIAEALEAAHEQGIIHRDLKTANIKVQDDGTVKVLDFGLAKALDTTPLDDPSQSPTLTAAATQMGVIMGTAAYMSPEQARGSLVDRRSDIWSFGVVLFEMLTGTRLFAGETVSDILAAVLRAGPEWSALPIHTPSSVRRLLRRCLERDRKQRLADISVARLEIDDAMGPAVEDVAPDRRLVPTEGWGAMLPWTVAAVATGAAVAAVWIGLQPSEPPPVSRLVVALPAEHELQLGYGSPFALSPDGRLLVYAAYELGSDGPQLFRRTLDQFDVSPIDGTQGARAPFFSPDGRWIGFYANDTLQKVSVAGGPPVKICDTQPLFPSASWGSDDTIVFTDNTLGLVKVSANAGTPEQLTLPNGADGEIRHFLPQVLPGGRDLLFTVAGPTGVSVAVLSLDSKGRRTLLDNAAGARYVSSGHLIYGDGTGSLLAVAFDLDRLAVLGAPVPLLGQVSQGPEQNNLHLAISDTGTLVYAPSDAGASNLTLVRVDRAGNAAPVVSDPAPYMFPRVSPDGRWIAVTVDNDVWIYDVEIGLGRRLTAGGSSLEPIWSEDGQHLTFTSADNNLYSVPVELGADPELLLSRAGRQYPSSWSPDDVLSFYERNPGHADVGLLEEGVARAILSGPYNEHSPEFSPDGRWLAYVSDETGEEEVYVTEYPSLRRSNRISTSGGREPVWSRDGRELFYRDGAAILMVVPVDDPTSPEFTFETPTPLFERYYYADPGGGTRYDVFPDGEHFVMLAGSPDAASRQLRVVEHWVRELVERVPLN